MHYTESTFLFRFEFLYFRICLFSLIAHGYNGWTFLIPPVTYVSFFSPSLKRVFVRDAAVVVSCDVTAACRRSMRSSCVPQQLVDRIFEVA